MTPPVGLAPDPRPAGAPAPAAAWRPAPGLFDLHAHADRVAVRTSAETLTYADLSARAAAFAAEHLGTTRRLVLVEAGNTVPALVAYLAAVQHGHVAVLVPAGRQGPLASTTAAYDPDVVVHAAQADGCAVVQRRAGSVHELHPDLALLLSTSGSTGSPKLVRLSRENLRSNADSIARYLRLTPDDRAATSLPMHYCYGLSVVNSHLLAGAGLVLTDASVVDECFWDLFAAARATSFAGVPHTFELLERSGFERRSLPTLRYVTQAGGRMAPDRVRHWARVGARDGWDLVVMYGQTEATARMAYLPPHLAESRPDAIGIAVPGGRLRLEPVPDRPEPGVGELVYAGPNVMMGYAESPAALGDGPQLTELRTGDLGRVVDGLFEVVGRRGRSAKLFGLRLDLDHLERTAAPAAGSREAGPELAIVATEDRLHVFTTARRTTAVGVRVADACGLPRSAVSTWGMDGLPRTANGKTDYAALQRRAAVVGAPAGPEAGAPTAAVLCEEYALVLGRAAVDPDDTFVALGGDSLSYVELATRLSRRIGDLPADWHTRPVAALLPPAAGATPRRPARAVARAGAALRGTAVDTSLVLRALAILAIVGTHADLFVLVGGAHLLLAVAGYNFARFQLAVPAGVARLRAGASSLVAVAVPSVAILGALAATTGFYRWPTVVFLNQALGSDRWDDQWQMWFLEAWVWISLAAVAATSLPVVARLERRSPWWFAAAVLAATLAVRYLWTGVEAGTTERYTVGLVAWCFALGWLASRATSWPQRTAVAAAALLATHGFFGDTQRELIVAGGVVLLACRPTVRLPRALLRPLGTLAGASLFIYLTHWQVYPSLEDDHPLLATLASVLVGIAVSWAAQPALRTLRVAGDRSRVRGSSPRQARRAGLEPAR